MSEMGGGEGGRAVGTSTWQVECEHLRHTPRIGWPAMTHQGV